MSITSVSLYHLPKIGSSRAVDQMVGHFAVEQMNTAICTTTSGARSYASRIGLSLGKSSTCSLRFCINPRSASHLSLAVAYENGGERQRRTVR
jgi:hypothetical protein